MKQQWAHQQHPAPRYQTDLLGYPGSPRGDVGIANLACTMRARKYTKRSIARVARVEMEPNGHHALQHLNWWLDVHHTGLLTPGTVPWRIDAFRDGNREVLMPGDFPIGDWCLVEKNCAHGKGLRTEHWIYDGTNSRAFRKLGHFWKIKQIPQPALVTD